MLNKLKRNRAINILRHILISDKDGNDGSGSFVCQECGTFFPTNGNNTPDPEDPDYFSNICMDCRFSPKESFKTTWTCKTYDLVASDEGGLRVNDIAETWEVDLMVRPEVHNSGLPSQFWSAVPFDHQVEEVFGFDADITIDGDDIHLYVNDEEGNPLGEMICTSHDCLSPFPVDE
jgi:hypothetical protein